LLLVSARDLNSAALRIMHNHRLAIRAEPHIELKAITAVRQSLIEGCKRIFRNPLSGASAAVAEEKWPG
jgi:hypothetical protein